MFIVASLRNGYTSAGLGEAGEPTVEFASQRALGAILRGLARGAALTERQADAIIRELIDEAELARSRHHDQDAAALEKLAEILGDEFEAGG